MATVNEGLLEFLRKKMEGLETSRIDAMYNAGLFDGKVELCKEIIDFVEKREAPGSIYDMLPKVGEIRTRSDLIALLSGDVPKADMIIELVKTARKINAIKELRGATGLGLKESKEYVEALDIKPVEEAPF